jgi:transcriptional regulator GlxA family with amidase domain
VVTELVVHRQECLNSIQRYIRQNLDQPLDRKALSEIAGYSVPHLHRIFIACTGETINTYVRRMRMIRAGQKLRMGASDIMEVALAAGYSTHAAFGKAFKQYFGLSPHEFRELGCAAATQLLRERMTCD